MYIKHTFVTLSSNHRKKTGEVSDMRKLHQTIISHIIGTTCCNLLTVYQNDSDSDYYLTNGFHLDFFLIFNACDVRVHSDNEHTDDFKMW